MSYCVPPHIAQLAKKLEDLIAWSRWANWRYVDPEPSTLSRRNYISAPVYAYSDFVWFDAIRWELKVPGRMLRTWYPFKKSELLFGDLSAH
eukprot:IDg3629t1